MIEIDEVQEVAALTGTEAFARHVRPRLMERLRAIGLDVEYHRGRGDSLFFTDVRGAEVEVLDFVGGFGSSLFGHNHPELVARVREVLDAERPFHAQASARGTAGLLGARLSRLVGGVTGREYVATLGSTGADAVEAAMKHAELERVRRVEALITRLEERAHDLRLRLRQQQITLPEELFDEAGRVLGIPHARTLDDVLMGIERVALDALECEPLFLAVEGAFHGKTTGSLRLTAGREYRLPWRHLGPETVFLPRGAEPEVAARTLAEAVERQRRTYYEIEVGADGALALVPRTFVHIAACFAEPIQGEGGVRELSAAYLGMLREAADEHGFPLVIDEIQSGLGRAGRVLASEPTGIRGDYYVFSKALGGGLAKVSAMLVDRERYVDDFGYLHTSTFADDDHSSAVALRVLDLLERDGGAVLERVRATGEYFLGKLRQLQARYPDQLREVRGRGLMIGIELVPPTDSPSPLLRVIAEQGLLAFVVCGHLLHEHRIRVAPTLTAHGTIRLQPSALVTREAIDRCCAAIERVLVMIRDADIHGLVRYVPRLDRDHTAADDHEASGDEAPSFTDELAAAGDGRERPSGMDAHAFEEELEHLAAADRHGARAGAASAIAPLRDNERTQLVGFLSHFTAPADLRDWEPGLASFTADECERFFERAGGMLGPFEVTRVGVRSANGSAIRGVVIGIPFTPAQVTEALRSGNVAWALELVREGVNFARRLGATLVGFGGYTSIVTNSCRDIVASDVGLTSGNSLTSAAALEALFMAAERIGVRKRRLGVVGAGGNIGLVLVEAVADRVDEIVLVGREGSRANRLLETAAATLTKRYGVPVEVGTSPAALLDCTLIISATSSPRPVILPEHVGPQPVVIVDVAVPGDVDPEVLTERPNAVVLRGGMVTVPGGQEVRVPGMRLGAGEIYGCLAETALLGLAGVREHFSYGALTVANVRRIAELARMHGFTITESTAAPTTAAMRGARSAG
jgi:acetylornithine/succinyldiaminopimelate/putrescine aminotransferase/predicted amino acid dehydrogenase